MNDSALDTADAAAEIASDFRGFLRSAGRLAVARQVSALCLVGVVFVLPTLTTEAIATDFVWSYFALLTLTSVFGLGLERLAAIVVVRRRDATLSRALAPILLVRVVSTPLVALGLWALLWFVGVTLSVAAWWATLAWVVAGLVVAVLFGVLRAIGNSVVEPAVMVAVRAAQAVGIVVLAVAGASVEVLVGLVALCEWAGVLAAARAIGAPRSIRGAWAEWRRLPVRQGLAFAGIEVVGIVKLRADLLLVGHIMGAVRGATYGLLYRVVDAFNGVVGSAGLWLFAESANAREGGVHQGGIRARSLAILPCFGILAGLVVVVGAGMAGAVVPRVAPDVDTLRLLAVAFPISSVNAVELHVRAGRGRAREVLWVNCITLAVNVPLCIGAIAFFGLAGAAGALVASEFVQAALLWYSAARDERTIVGPALATSVAGAVALLATATAMSTSRWLLSGLGATAVLGLLLQRMSFTRRNKVLMT